MPTRSTPGRSEETPAEVSNKTLRALAKLEGDILNPEVTTLVDRIKSASAGGEQALPEAVNYALIEDFDFDKDEVGEYCFGAADIDPTKVDPSRYKDLFENPSTYDEAWNHDDPFQREKWREAITKELTKMEEKGVWSKIKRSDMDEGRRCVKHKWVLEIKRSGRFRARLVACGYSQIPGVDFTETYSPVVNDITFRIALTLKVVYGMDSKVFDVETAFLHGELKEVIYMDCPLGFDHEEGECLRLEKSIYGLVQASCRYGKKFSDVLVKQLGFQRSDSDPCLFMRGEGDERLIILTYVDDNLVLGKTKMIDAFLEEFKKTEFTFTVEDTLEDYLSCEVKLSPSKTAWIGQPHMIKKIEKTFGEEVKSLKEYLTPGTPGFKLKKPDEGDTTPRC